MIVQPRTKPPGFDFVPGVVMDCQGPGLARHDIDLEKEFINIYSAQMDNPYSLDFTQGKFVDP